MIYFANFIDVLVFYKPKQTMRKLLCIFVLLCFSVGSYSQKIKLDKGVLDFLKSEKTLAIDFTYNNMRVGRMSEDEYVQKKTNEYNQKESGKGDRWAETWINNRSKLFEPNFIEQFNTHMIKKNGISIGNDAEYLMLINTDFTEPGYNVTVSSRRSSINITCKFIHKETEQEIAQISVTGISASESRSAFSEMTISSDKMDVGSSYDAGYRIQVSYEKAGRELAKFLIKRTKL